MRKDDFKPSWCRWANDERLVCSFRGRERDKYLNKVYPVTRLVAVNHDGSQQKKLLQNPFQPSGQINDRIIDWTPEDPRGVLIEKFNPRIGLRVLKLDVYSGETELYENGHTYIGSFGTDGHGKVRLGWGRYQLKNYYFAKLEGEKEWRQLTRVTTLSTDEGFMPIAVIRGTNYAYAMRDHEGRAALWKIDLADKEDPQLVFASSRVDVRPVYTPDNRVLAVYPDSGSKDAFYVEPGAELLGEVLGKLFKDKMYYIAGHERRHEDRGGHGRERRARARVPCARHERPAGRNCSVSARGFPGLANTDLARTEYLFYPARDGTQIPAFLTRPVNAVGTTAAHRHAARRTLGARQLGIRQLGAGAGARRLRRTADELSRLGWLRQRSGARPRYKDWGGLPYSDTIDGLKWAVAQKHADPARICVVGGSFGGYLALTAAVRDSPLLKCVVSVAGVSDLRELKSDSNFFSNSLVVKDMIGSDPEKLQGGFAAAARRQRRRAGAAAARRRGLHRRAGSVGVHGQGAGGGEQAVQDGHDAKTPTTTSRPRRSSASCSPRSRTSCVRCCWRQPANQAARRALTVVPADKSRSSRGTYFSAPPGTWILRATSAGGMGRSQCLLGGRRTTNRQGVVA